MRKYITYFTICIGTIMFALVYNISVYNTNNSYVNISADNLNKEVLYIINEQHYNDTIHISTISNSSYKIKQELINEVTRYMGKQAKGHHKELPNILVSNCLYNNIDICFVMAQTQVETNFGTVGAGRDTSKRSLFGVGIYTGTKQGAYESYDVAVSEYIKLLKTGYLVNGKDEQSLMSHYVNKHGYRYAEDLTYEVKLRKTYNDIKQTTNIHKLQQKY